MKLRKLFVGIALFIFVSMQTACFAQSVSDSDIRNITSKYRAKNYLGCVQASEKILESNPSNIYALYYKGISYMQLGLKTEAVKAFNDVVSLNSNKTIVEYATRGLACLNNSVDCAKYAETTNDLENFIKSNKFCSSRSKCSQA